jgi:hypothetical protein
MVRIVLAVAALAVSSVALAIPAKAACPPGTAYNCQQMPNGKMSCGCR